MCLTKMSVTTGPCAFGEDLGSLLPAGFKEFRDELERKKEQCPLPDCFRSSLWVRRDRLQSRGSKMDLAKEDSDWLGRQTA